MNKIKKRNSFENNSNLDYKRIESQLDFLLEGQEINQKELRLGFIGLAKQNQELLELNKQLETVVEELNILKKEREEKVARAQARANRKRLPKRDPMTREIYKELIQAVEGPTYLNVRLGLAFCILAVTGIRINELVPLKVYQLQTLIKYNWIAIDRSKRGPSNHKAFLTKEGKKIIKDRRKDFELIFLMKGSDSYVFTSEANHYQMLSRETITRDINRVMALVSEQLADKPKIRIGYITQLWKDTKDIEFVKQSIGHRRLDTTSAYVENLSDQERQQRTSQLK
jgi:site-specific recombinase XerD